MIGRITLTASDSINDENNDGKAAKHFEILHNFSFHFWVLGFGLSDLSICNQITFLFPDPAGLANPAGDSDLSIRTEYIGMLFGHGYFVSAEFPFRLKIFYTRRF